MNDPIILIEDKMNLKLSCHFGQILFKTLLTIGLLI